MRILAVGMAVFLMSAVPEAAPVAARVAARVTARVVAQVTAQQVADYTCRIEWATMRDGVRLATEVYLPSEPGRYPVVLTRSPYNRGSEAMGSVCDNARSISLARSGYAALNQDVRGRYRSEGTFDPFQQEGPDGYDAVEWAAAQPWSNGKVGVSGSSYMGVTSWQATASAPPHLVATTADIAASDYHNHWIYVNGALDILVAQGWTYGYLAADTYRRHLDGIGTSAERTDHGVAAWLDEAKRDLLSRWTWQLPLESLGAFRTVAPYYYDWLAHPNFAPYWAQVDLETRYAEVTVPTLNTGGWYDVFQVGTVQNFLGVSAQGGTDQARNSAKLVMGCCGHTRMQGLIQWGPDAQLPGAALNTRWFDYWLKGLDDGITTMPAVQLVVLVPPDEGTQGDAFWVTGDRYPLPGTERVKFNLRSGGRANTRNGDGVLDASGYASGPPDRYVYDPRDPVPTAGGNLCCGPLLERGAVDQSEVELRDDVLVYTSEPLTEDLAVIGPVSVALWAASSAYDTDFTAKLVDVHPDGIAHNVLDRIVRARFREGSRKPPQPITPGQAYEYRIDLGHTGTMFRAGHRVRLEISSSNFPHYDRNPNTGLPIGQESELRKATQTIHHDVEHPSFLEMPVAPGITIPVGSADH